MDWKVAEAKQRFSELLREAVTEPQLIHNRSRLVAVVVGAAEAAAFLEWRRQASRSVADAIDEIGRICGEEGYSLEIAPRVDRENPLLRAADARRHQRRQ
jgi:prevent-host-death family protein